MESNETGMKGITTFLVFMFLITARAQSYIPIVGELNEWQFTTCFNGCVTISYFTAGDTTHNGEQYKILDGYHYVSRTFLLKEDPIEQKVYLTKLNGNQSSTYLLYDFSLNEGDTMDLLNPNSPLPLHEGYFQLDSIRPHVLNDGLSHRFFYFSPASSNTVSIQHPVWAEGIGSLSLINCAGGTPDLNDVGALSCYFLDGQSVYSNLDSIAACQPTHFLNTIQNEVDQLEIYPNPAQGKVFIKGGLNQEVQLLDGIGRLIQSTVLSNGEWIIEMPPGVYFICDKKSGKAYSLMVE